MWPEARSKSAMMSPRQRRRPGHYLDDKTGDLPDGLPTPALNLALFFGSIGRMAVAIDSPFTLGGSRVWCQAHTGAFGQMNRNKGDTDRVARDWMKMKEDVWPTSVS